MDNKPALLEHILELNDHALRGVKPSIQSSFEFEAEKHKFLPDTRAGLLKLIQQGGEDPPDAIPWISSKLGLLFTFESDLFSKHLANASLLCNEAVIRSSCFKALIKQSGIPSAVDLLVATTQKRFTEETLNRLAARTQRI
jgi:hypothetical protein